MANQTSYYELLTEAVNHFDETGFVSAEDLAFWTQRLREAALRELVPEHVLEDNLRSVLKQTYEQTLSETVMGRRHPGVSRFTLQQVAPQLRSELDRRILASAGLIKLNREAAVEKTMQRFAGWATSIPEGGSAATDKRDTKKDIRKSLTALPFEERRVLVDQGHKLVSAVNDIVATAGGAIAAIWHSHAGQANYNYRKVHAKREGHIFLISGSWAQLQGLVKPGPDGYVKDIDQPGEFVFCRCWFQYVYNLRDLPAFMLTKKGEQTLTENRARVAAMRA